MDHIINNKKKTQKFQMHTKYYSFKWFVTIVITNLVNFINFFFC